MRSFFTLLIILCLGHQAARCQDTTKVLFIGNSFTAANNLSDLVHQFLIVDGKPVVTHAYAPGGISVGDVHMGTAAHMNNPVVFDLIREKDWDFLVLQDNQGRFALDSAIFPSTTASKVIEGHLKIRDSFHANHPCGKMILFSGWGFKDEDIDMIDKITVNYRVYNDSAKDVIAPIGPAWKRSILDRPHYDLWEADGAHPGMPGSFLTAAVIYGTISERDVMVNPFNGMLPPPDATYLKEKARLTLTDPLIREKSNLEGIKPVNIRWDKPKLKGTPGKLVYRWYRDGKLVATTTDSSWAPTANGTYRLWTKTGDGSWQKSCNVKIADAVGIDDPIATEGNFSLFPNPASATLYVDHKETITVEVYSLTGVRQLSAKQDAGRMQLDISALAPGIYLVKCLDQEGRALPGAQHFVKQ